MRTKTRRGGRRKPTRRSVDSSPSSMAAPSVPDRDVFDNTLNEASRKETRVVLDKVDCFQKDTCIRCDESGDLLVCTEIGCPISLHEYCMSCQPSFDEDGHFYCPYCSYKNALVLVNELRRKAMVAKRVLSDFVDTRMVSGGNSLLMGEAGKKRAFDVSTRGVDADLINHGNHLGNESLQDRVMQVELNRSNEGEDHVRTAGDVQPGSLVGDNGANHDGPIVCNVSNDIRSIPEVQPCEDSMKEGENLEADRSGTHQVENLEDKKDEKMMEEENLRSTDVIEDEEIVKDQGQPETPSCHHDEEEASVDDVDHGATIEEENLMSTDDIEYEEIVKDQGQPETPSCHHDEEEVSVDGVDHGATIEEENLMSANDIEDEEILKDQSQPETPSAHHDEEEDAVDDVDHEAGRESEDTGDGGEQIQPDKEGMLVNIDPASGNNDLKNEQFVKKKRFKTKANRKADLQIFNSPRKSLCLRTSDPGDKSPHIQPPEPGKNHATKLEKVPASRKLKQPASPDQLKNLNFDGRKCKRVRWSTEEEEMLKEGVQRFSSTAKKNLPWRKILEFGRHIFDNTRTPVDLKDKWKNILAK